MPQNVPLSIEKELLQQIAGGDEAAFGRLFSLVVPVLQRSVLKLVASEEGMQEVIQETFIRVWLNRDKLPELDKPVHWLFRVASNESLTYLRKKALQKRHLNVYAGGGGEKSAEEEQASALMTLKETSLLVQQAVNRLPPQRQLIYRMSRNEGLKNSEIAEKLGVTDSHVRNTLVMALQSIREYLAAAGKVVPLMALFFKNF
ncbi:RNA polymerase sigma-70 factor (ECF subfamily) [Filimonas zeae]|uniref:DNA-directed RNA polymerase sigma-70 factor n=1 Tax=Filimonas zeae TaxID=1737353 RepID=A0A917IS77_9BACT|nr:sigma-70 family RNA polymerase sigma factor [Filimonas zeae]MDR6337967.1 RNA polymerase sigma-70 factor (ECF subfamily) [Filimonas zeae]GGH61078.1 DNA-directed RNA polymerase sigma-70 factor [Filimonas zeae]